MRESDAARDDVRVAGGRPGAAEPIVIIGYVAGDLGNDRLGGIRPGTFAFVYMCFLVLGRAFGMTPWLTRR